MINENELYIPPRAEIAVVPSEDIITTSSGGAFDGEEDEVESGSFETPFVKV